MQANQSLKGFRGINQPFSIYGLLGAGRREQVELTDA